MLNQLPNLFDRNFAIGYFLPVIVFAAVSYALIRAFDLSFLLPVLTTIDPLANTVISLLLSWLIAILLLAMNRSLYMLVEGYGRFNPARLFQWKEKWRYRRLLEKKEEQIEAFLRTKDQAKRATIRTRLSKLERVLAETFPSSERFLLPTRFGNIMRAFEDYPRVLYGLEAVEGWNRLLSVVPKDYRELANDAKAQTDFWLNIFMLSLLSIGGYVGLAMYGGITTLWFPIVALMVALIAVRFARISAVEWGDAVKASFDTFLPELGKKLAFPSSATRKDQEELWNFFSKIIVFRSREDLDDFNNKIDHLSQVTPDGSANPLECIYTVQEGDTIDHIAQRFGITVEELVKINNITDTELISVGQRLRVWPK